MPAKCSFNPSFNVQVGMTASIATPVPAVETLTHSISIFSDLLCIGNNPDDEWICGDDDFYDELHDKLLCEAIWAGPQCVPPRMTYPGGPCQVPQCCHGQARLQFNGWFCHGHCMQLQEIRQPLKSAKVHRDFLMEFVYRVQEIMCRQHTDKGHWQRLCNLACRAPLGQFCSCLAVLSKLCNDFSTRQDPQVLTPLCFTSGLLLHHPCLQGSRVPEDTHGVILQLGCKNSLEMLC